METCLPEQNVLPKELSDLTFEEIRSLKDKFGLNSLSDIILGNSNKRLKHNFHRDNKNRPREISSKIPVSFKCETNLSNKNIRDPRFDSSCGTFKREVFENDYKFVNKIKKKERILLKEQLKNEEIDSQEYSNISSLLQRMDNQKREEIRTKRKNNLKNIEKQYQIQERSQGRKPIYNKKSDLKLLELVQQFDNLKRKGKLQKHIKRLRKKNAHRDKTKLKFSNDKY